MIIHLKCTITYKKPEFRLYVIYLIIGYTKINLKFILMEFSVFLKDLKFPKLI